MKPHADIARQRALDEIGSIQDRLELAIAFLQPNELTSIDVQDAMSALNRSIVHVANTSDQLTRLMAHVVADKHEGGKA